MKILDSLIGWVIGCGVVVVVVTSLAIMTTGCNPHGDNLPHARYPETIQTPDGLTFKRYKVEQWGEHDQYVYVAGDTISVNQDQRSGKTTVNEVSIFYKGKPIPLQKIQELLEKDEGKK